MSKFMGRTLGLAAVAFAGAELSSKYDFYTVVLMLMLGLGMGLFIGDG